MEQTEPPITNETTSLSGGQEWKKNKRYLPTYISLVALGVMIFCTGELITNNNYTTSINTITTSTAIHATLLRGINEKGNDKPDEKKEEEKKNETSYEEKMKETKDDKKEEEDGHNEESPPPNKDDDKKNQDETLSHVNSQQSKDNSTAHWLWEMSDEKLTRSIKWADLFNKLIQMFVVGIIPVYGCCYRKWAKEDKKQKYLVESLEYIYGKIMGPLCDLMYTTGDKSGFEIMHVARRACDNLRTNPLLQEIGFDRPPLIIPYNDDQHEADRQGWDEKVWNEYMLLHHKLEKCLAIQQEQIIILCDNQTAEDYGKMLLCINKLIISLVNTYHNKSTIDNMAKNHYEDVDSPSNLTAAKARDDFVDGAYQIEEQIENLDQYMLALKFT
mmetsp:Transcript_44690/g.49873  ORF Transcript_44690/g.49873 Transcript_44690/m.49873 type:complete len:387 (-) Transcript_44690:510-1670(-)